MQDEWMKPSGGMKNRHDQGSPESGRGQKAGD